MAWWSARQSSSWSAHTERMRRRRFAIMLRAWLPPSATRPRKKHELAIPRPQRDPLRSQGADGREPVAQVQGLRADDLHQGIGGKSLRLPEMRFSRTDRPASAVRLYVRRG